MMTVEEALINADNIGVTENTRLMALKALAAEVRRLNEELERAVERLDGLDRWPDSRPCED